MGKNDIYQTKNKNYIMHSACLYEQLFEFLNELYSTNGGIRIFFIWNAVIGKMSIIGVKHMQKSGSWIEITSEMRITPAIPSDIFTGLLNQS